MKREMYQIEGNLDQVLDHIVVVYEATSETRNVK